MRFGLAVVAAIAVATPAGATDWRLLSSASSPEGQSAYYLVDRDSIVTKGDHKEGTIYLIADNVSMNLKIEFDCPGNRLRPLGGTLDMDGKITQLGVESWDSELPASHPEMFGYVCSFDPKAKDDRRSFGAGDPVKAVREILKK